MDESNAWLAGGTVEVVGCHAAGRCWIHQDNTLRNYVLNEPRGGVFKHVNLLVPPVDPGADIGFIIMEPMHSPPMSGSNSICVATVVLETGIVPMQEPTTVVILEAPGGLVEATARCSNGKVESVTVRNLPSFAVDRDAMLDVPGIGEVRVNTAWGGDSFVMVDVADLDITIEPANGLELARLGTLLTTAANEQLVFEHPVLDWTHFSFCQIAGPLEHIDEHRFSMQNTIVVEPGKLDRSPTGTGLSARMAMLHAQGLMKVGDELTMRSVIDSEFVGRIEAETSVGERQAISPLITGTAWRVGRYSYELDPTDPWPGGYRISDTWPQ